MLFFPENKICSINFISTKLFGGGHVSEYLKLMVLQNAQNIGDIGEFKWMI